MLPSQNNFGQGPGTGENKERILLHVWNRFELFYFLKNLFRSIQIVTEKIYVFEALIIKEESSNVEGMSILIKLIKL